jgi:hypothetical protein
MSRLLTAFAAVAFCLGLSACDDGLPPEYKDGKPVKLGQKVFGKELYMVKVMATEDHLYILVDPKTEEVFSGTTASWTENHGKTRTQRNETVIDLSPNSANTNPPAPSPQQR